MLLRRHGSHEVYSQRDIDNAAIDINGRQSLRSNAARYRGASRIHGETEVHLPDNGVRTQKHKVCVGKRVVR